MKTYSVNIFQKNIIDVLTSCEEMYYLPRMIINIVSNIILLIYCYICRFRDIINQKIAFTADYEISFVNHNLAVKMMFLSGKTYKPTMNEYDYEQFLKGNGK